MFGGLLSEHVAWEWIFFINIPLGIATAALAMWAIDESRDPVERRLDVRGLIASTISLSTLTFALIEGHGRGWDSWPILASFAIAAATAVWFVAVEMTVDDPMVDLALFRDRVFSGALISLMLWAFGLFGIYFFTSLYLQGVLGFSPTRAGLTFVPMALCMAVAAAMSDSAARRFGAHRSVSFGMALMGAAMASIALFGQDAGMLDLMPSLIAIGIGGGLTIPLTATVLGVMPQDQAGVASGVFNTSRELAGLLGITIIGVILTGRETSALRGGALPLDAFLSGYRVGLITAGALVMAGAVASWVALRTAENEPVVNDDVLVAA